jgi:hypothetical protein
VVVELLERETRERDWRCNLAEVEDKDAHMSDQHRGTKKKMF